MPDSILFQAHVVSSLCDLQLEDEFGEEPLPKDSRQRLEDLGKTLQVLRQSLLVRRPWPQSARFHASSAESTSRNLLEVFQSALGCEACLAESCPVKAMVGYRVAAIVARFDPRETAH